VPAVQRPLALAVALTAVSYTVWLFVIGARLRFDVVNSTVTESLRQDVITSYGVHKSGIRRRQLELSPKTWRSRLRNLAKRLIRYTPLDVLVLAIERINLRRRGYEQIIAISPGTQRELVAEYKIPSDHITVVPCGVDIDRFQLPTDTFRARARARYRVNDGPAVVTVATEFRRKGIRELVVAAAGLVQDYPGLLVLVAGRDNPSELQALAEQLRIGNHIRFVGRVPDLQEFMAAGDLFVLPTKYEGFGLTILEAMAVGLPVVTTRTGVGELLSHDRDALLLKDPSDTEELIAMMRELLGNAGRRRALGAAARAFAERMTWRHSADATVTVYRRVVNYTASSPARSTRLGG